MYKEAVVFSGVCLWFGVDRQSQRGSSSRANSRKKFLEKGIFTSEKRAIKACLTQEHIFFGCNVTP